MNFASYKTLKEYIKEGSHRPVPKNSTLEKYLDTFKIDFDKQDVSSDPLLITKETTKNIIFHYHAE